MKQKALFLMLLAGVVAGVAITYFVMSSEGDRDVEITHDMVVEKVEALGNLEVVKYNIRDVMEYRKTRQWLPNAKTALIVVGEVIVCIDLTKILEGDVYTEGDSIRLTLPRPEICHTKVDHSRSRVYNIEYGFFETEKIVDEAYRAAEKELQQRAHNMNFETEARNNADLLLRPLLASMGFGRIVITYRHVDSHMRDR